jgi:predicted nucleotidyltransferase
MTRTAAQLTASDVALYRATAQRRAAGRARHLAQRRAHAEALARQAADMLRARFGVTRVVLFGSLAHPGRFHELSDIDLAVDGLQSSHYFRAVGALEELGAGLRFDLVDLADSRDELRSAITSEGKLL